MNKCAERGCRNIETRCKDCNRLICDATFKDESYAYKYRIAKAAYRDIMTAIERWEGKEGLIQISFHWDECITVDDQLFHGHELRKD